MAYQPLQNPQPVVDTTVQSSIQDLLQQICNRLDTLILMHAGDHDPSAGVPDSNDVAQLIQ